MIKIIERPSHRALFILGFLLFLFSLTLLDAAWRSGTIDYVASRALVRELGLSDLSLFTEARYTRHPSQADRHAPFQDHPAALEHFPTGSLLPPPKLLMPFIDRNCPFVRSWLANDSTTYRPQAGSCISLA